MIRRPKYRERFMSRIRCDRDIYLDTFGEEHVVFGRRIFIVCDQFELLKRQIKQGIKVEEFGISDSQIHFYARCEDLPPRKASGEVFELDGRIFIISDWLEDEGMAEITASISAMM